MFSNEENAPWDVYRSLWRRRDVGLPSRGGKWKALSARTLIIRLAKVEIKAVGANDLTLTQERPR